MITIIIFIITFIKWRMGKLYTSIAVLWGQVQNDMPTSPFDHLASSANLRNPPIEQNVLSRHHLKSTVNDFSGSSRVTC